MRTSIMRLGVLALGLAACGTNDGGGDDDVDCSMVTGTDTFVVGLDHVGKNGVYDFKLMDAMPAPPIRGNNSWVLQVSAMNAGVVGAPVDGATIKVTPFMPAHQHGTGVTAEITPTGVAGQYTLSPVNLWMQGVWETTIRATVDASTDTTVFKFCVD
jgi:hypothetical protein